MMDSSKRNMRNQRLTSVLRKGSFLIIWSIVCVALIIIAFEVLLRIQLQDGLDITWDPVLVESDIPGLFYRLAPNFNKGNVRTNEDGLNWRSMSSEHPKRKILILGDSVSFAGNFPPEQNYSNQLEQLLSKETGELIAVWNAGTPGYNTTQEFILLSDIGPKLNPDLIIIQFCMNDYQLPPVLNDRHVLQHREWVNRAGETRIDLLGFIHRSKALFFLKAKLKDMQKTHPEWFPKWSFYTHYVHKKPGWAKAKRALGSIRDWVKQQDAELLVVIFPVEWQLRIQDNSPQTDLVHFAKSEGIPVLDLSDSFGKHWRDGLFIDYSTTFRAVDKVHLNEKGHALAALEIASFILEHPGYFLKLPK
jgi:lysophospholipase L1-like esterase